MTDPDPDALPPPEPGHATSRRLETMPREVGVVLVTVGALGLVAPGVVGVPAVLAGGLVLWPRGFRRVDRWLGRRFPSAHRQGLNQIGRFLDDLERRYPTPAPDRGPGE